MSASPYIIEDSVRFVFAPVGLSCSSTGLVAAAETGLAVVVSEEVDLDKIFESLVLGRGFVGDPASLEDISVLVLDVEVRVGVGAVVPRGTASIMGLSSRVGYSVPDTDPAV